MRSRVALLVLVLVAGFVLATAWDRCEAGDADCPPLCHAGCLDGCATAPVPQAHLATHVVRAELPGPPVPVQQPIARSFPPEAQPPRG